MDGQNRLPHLRIDRFAEAKDYTSRQEGRDNFKMPPRPDHQAHGEALLRQREGIEGALRERVAEGATCGVVLSFRGAPGYELRLKSLESSRAGIELLSAKNEDDGSMTATVFVPQGKLSHFSRLVSDYLDTEKETKKGNPKNQPVVSSISGIKLAALEHLWTDPPPFPDLDTPIAWEVWLRCGDEAADPLDVFNSEAAAAGMRVSNRSIRFPDRIVVMATGTAGQLASSLTILDVLAELRRAKECPTFFLDMPAQEQRAWIGDLAGLVTAPPAETVAVCVLDSGIHQTHPLLNIALAPQDVLTCFPGGPVADHNHHGTEMGGLALYGDLMTVLESR